MAKKIVTNSNENQEQFIEALKIYKEKIEKLNERAYLKSGIDASHALYEIALKLVRIQNASKDNMVTRTDISDAEYSKLHSYAKYRDMSIEEVLSSLIENLRYVSRGKSFDFVAKLDKLSQDLKSVYEEYYHKRDQFPLNAIEKENYKFLANLETGLSIEMNIELILKAIYPGMLDESKEFKTTSKAYKISRDKTQVFEYAKIVREQYADDSNNLDSIFAEKNEKFFIELSRFLNSQWIDFDEFVSKYVSNEQEQYNYTHCYTADSTRIGPLLVDYYVENYRTTKYMQDVEPYIASKLKSAMDLLNIHEIGKLIRYWKRPSDNANNDCAMSPNELKIRENEFIKIINSRFGGVVPDKLKSIDRKTYDLLSLLTKRNGFSNNGEYISAIGLTRKEPTSTGTNKGINFFTDYDFERYEIFRDVKTMEDFDELMRYYAIKLINADETHLKTYRNLAYGKQDSRAIGCKNSKVFD